MIAATPFQGKSEAREAKWELLVTLPVGELVGEIPHKFKPGFGRPQGPEAFTVSSDGTIYILDSAQQRIYKIRGQKDAKGY